MKRIQSNIVNLAFVIQNASAEDSKGRPVKSQGLELNQAIVNGVSQGVSLKTINGSKKSAPIQLDREALTDLLGALNEVLAAENK